jgi:hypothetical protein
VIRRVITIVAETATGIDTRTDYRRIRVPGIGFQVCVIEELQFRIFWYFWVW